jgi:hypothetical protein
MALAGPSGFPEASGRSNATPSVALARVGRRPIYEYFICRTGTAYANARARPTGRTKKGPATSQTLSEVFKSPRTVMD